MKKNIYAVIMLVLMGMLGGCAGISPTRAPAQLTGTADFAYQLAKDDSGILYGLVYDAPTNNIVTSVKFACDAIHNTDERCSHPDDYVVGKIYSRSHAMNGGAVVVILMQKDKEIKPCWKFWNNNTCTFVKVQTEKGKFGTVVEVVSLPGEDNCYFKAINISVAGVVCKSPKWEAIKDMRDYSASEYALTGVVIEK